MAALGLAFFCITTSLLFVGSYSFITLKSDEKPLQFTYSGAMGPENWAKLNSNFSLCANGKSQSPIDIVTGRAVADKKLKPLNREYTDVANVTLVDYKFTVGIEYPDDAGGLNLDGKDYSLKQMHWHSPSEHRINGNRYAAELHMVHVSDDGQMVVVGTLFKYGRPDPVFAKIHNKLNAMVYNEASPRITLGPFRIPAELRQTPTKYYKYVGSFSIPPCTENIIYIILPEERTISREQVETFKAPLDMRCKNNARPCQPINRRRVDVYKASTHK